MALPFSLLSFLKLIPRGIAIIYAIFLIFSSASVAIRENNPSAFFLSFGEIVAGADSEINDNMDILIQAKSEQKSDFIAFINVLGGIFLIYYILGIFRFIMGKSFEMASSIVILFYAIIILFLLQTIFYTATVGHIYIGFQGLTKFALNFDSWIFPIGDWIFSIGQASIKSPFF